MRPKNFIMVNSIRNFWYELYLDDCFKNYQEEILERDVKTHVFTNLTVSLATWGGGYYPSSKFYLCDGQNSPLGRRSVLACNIYIVPDFAENKPAGMKAKTISCSAIMPAAS